MDLVDSRWGKGFSASKILVAFYHGPLENHISEHMEMFLILFSMIGTNSSPFHASLMILIYL